MIQGLLEETSPLHVRPDKQVKHRIAGRRKVVNDHTREDDEDDDDVLRTIYFRLRRTSFLSVS